ncbi:hypothetical protein [Blastococcus sp. SYSU D00813]
MAETADDGAFPTPAVVDPFVAQIDWLVAMAGGKDQLVQRCGGLVSVRTLDNWAAGNYPRTKVTGAVRDLDAWARKSVPGYPGAAGVQSLVESCGPRALAPFAPPPPADEPAEVPAPEEAPRRGRRWPRWTLGAAVLAVVALVSVLATIAVLRDDPAAGDLDDPASTQALVDVPLPSTGDGTLYVELSGSIGANTFGDPRTLQDRGAAIPPDTEIEVRCRYYAPSVPSVTPDGFWYLIESEPWNGLWTPANSFMNGDVPGGPYIHNTDFAVPVCR